MEKELVNLLIKDLTSKNIGWGELPSRKLGSNYILETTFQNNFTRINEDAIDASGLRGEEDKVLEKAKAKIEGSESREFLEYVKRGVSVEVKSKRLIAKLIDYDNVKNNEFTLIKDAEFSRIKPDVTFFINGIPLVTLEAKDPQEWGEKAQDEALSQLLRYKREESSLFKFVQIGIAYTDKANSVYVPMVEGTSKPAPSWWKNDDKTRDIYDFLKIERVLDIIRWFTFYKEKDEKVVPRYIQYWPTRKAIERAEEYIEGGNENRGLIWHWQGSGKTYTMIFTAYQFFWKFYNRDPIVFFVVDRKDLQEQLYEDFIKNLHAPDFSDRVRPIGSIEELKDVLKEIKESELKGTIKRGIYIVLVHKFSPKELSSLEPVNKREILVLVDEAHRSHYGDLGAALERSLPNAIFYAFTGTPVMKFEEDTFRNTFTKFSPKGELYLDKYFIEDSTSDRYTVPWRYRVAGEVKGTKVRIGPEKIRSLIQKWMECAEEVGSLSDFAEEESVHVTNAEEKPVHVTKEEIDRELNNIKLFLENPKHLEAIARYIAENIEQDTENFRFKSMIVTASRLASVKMKRFLDEALTEKFGERAKEWSEVVITYFQNDHSEISEYLEEFLGRWGRGGRDWGEANRAVQDRFKDKDLPRILIVADKLITGFDCPRLKVMYLYKQLYDHRLLQAIARVNRPYSDKEFGLIVDFAGVIDRAKEAVKKYELLDKETTGQLDDAVSKLDEEFEEFKGLLQDVKGELRRGVPIGPHKVFLDIEELSVEEDYLELDATAKILAFGHVSFESKAVDIINKIRRVIRLYKALGSYSKKLDYHGEVAILSKLYNAVMHYEKGKKLPKGFWEELVELIYEKTTMPEIGNITEEEDFEIADLKRVIDEIDKGKISEVAPEAILTFRSLLDLESANPAYKHIYNRIKELEKKWSRSTGSEIADEIAEFRNLAQEFIGRKEKWPHSDVVGGIVSDVRVYTEKEYDLSPSFEELSKKLREIADTVKEEGTMLDGDRMKLKGAVKRDLIRARKKAGKEVPIGDISKITEDITRHAEERIRHGAG